MNREGKKVKEVFIRQEPTAGREIEFDWGEVKLFIKNSDKHRFNSACRCFNVTKLLFRNVLKL